MGDGKGAVWANMEKTPHPGKTNAHAARMGGSFRMTDALTTALIWTLFLLVIPPVSAVCWVVVWWHGA